MGDAIVARVGDEGRRFPPSTLHRCASSHFFFVFSIFFLSAKFPYFVFHLIILPPLPQTLYTRRQAYLKVAIFCYIKHTHELSHDLVLLPDDVEH